ncbi:MAG: asparagine synthase-related protein [Anaerolineaceae bacterium]
MNIVLGFVGKNAYENFLRLKTTANHYIEDNLPLNIASSNDGYAVFGLLQPSGFYPLEKPIYDQNNQALCMIQGYFWYQSHFPLDEKQAVDSLIKACHFLLTNNTLALSEDDGGLFNFVCYDGKTRKVFFTNDYSGIFPFYYSINRDGIYFSSHIRVIAKALSKQFDPVSIIQQTAFHYTIGKRTSFNDIYRLNPGETLTFSVDLGTLKYKQPENIYSKITPYKNDNEAVEALHADYEQGLNEICRVKKKRGIMLSGGFDTRLVSYGFHHQDNAIIGLTLGDNENFEVNIARKLISRLDSTHHIHSPVSDCHLNRIRIENLMSKFENINFAYCDTGGELLKQMGSETVSTGYGGETFFGGQGYSFYGQALDMKKRFKIAFSRSLGFPVKFFDPLHEHNLENSFHLIFKHHENYLNSAKNWFTPVFFHEYQQEAIRSLNDNIREELMRITAHETSSVQQILERFWLEHHVLKEFGKQEWILSAHLPLVLPTLHHSFLKRCSNLPPNRKIDHGFYLKFVKRYFGKLANFPTSNIPLPLNFPTPILWLSRAVRARYDQKLIKKIMNSAGKSNSARAGWSNFEQWFRHGDFLNQASTYIDPLMFSKNHLDSKVARWLNWDEKIFSGQDLLTMITISQLIK